METVIRAGAIVTGNDRNDIIDGGYIVIRDDRIARVLPKSAGEEASWASVVDATDLVAIPGFVQTHVHLCQTLFRGLADDLELLDWLRLRIFPYEAAHDPRSVHASALLGIGELIRSGTTTILDMGTVHHEEEIIRAVGESGIRACVGKAMMDLNDSCPRLRETTTESLTSTRALAERWHNSFGGRVRYAVAPRFVLSCTDALLRGAHEISASMDHMIFHTHASENRGEIEAVRARCGMENIEYLHRIGVLNETSCLAHCIHLNAREFDLLKTTGASVSHCPSSNLKLGSGIANIPHMIERGINVSLGADGAPCNNTLDMFREMRLASTLQKPAHGPAAMPARDVFRMATMGGARALGLQDEIGSIEPGKKADLAFLNLRRIWNPGSIDFGSGGNVYSAIVYTAGPENVESVMIDGRWLYHKREFVELDERRIVDTAARELRSLLDRAEAS